MVKNGRRKGCQLYKCKSCGRRFVGGNRLKANDIISDYVEHKMTLSELSSKYHKSVSTIQRRLRQMRHVHVISKHKDVTVQMDTTYWGRNFGLMVIRDAVRGKILWHKYVRHETIADYVEGVGWLEKNGFTVYGIVCDGLRGLFQALSRYPVQMCQVHQQRIVRTYLTRNPELEASRELLALSKRLTVSEKGTFMEELNTWSRKWSWFLSERSVEKTTGKTHFTHKTLRSAYLSLKRNMPYLWTYQDHPNLGIPNTNNALEGTFTDIKSKLRAHSGIKKANRLRFLDEYISRHYY